MAYSRQTAEKFGIPRSFVDDLKDGYYAIRAKSDADSDFVFLRVSRPETGEFAGCVKVQLQSGSTLRLVLVLHRNDVFEVLNGDIKQIFIRLLAGRVRAMVDYGRKANHCCKCGKPLTREPWVSIGIGSECDDVYPEVRAAYEEELALAAEGHEGE